MKQLMFSLDQKILDPSSSVAARMIAYGKEKELFIVVPTTKKIQLNLAPSVHVYGSGGSSKITQFFGMCKTARSLVPQNKIVSVTTQDPFFTGLLGLRLSHKFKIPLEVQVHGDFFGGTYYASTISGKLRNLLASFVLRYADTVRTVGERVKQSLVGRGVPESKIIVRPVALNSATVDKRIEGVGLRPFVWAGRMEREKNLSFLLEVFVAVIQSHRAAELVLIGAGSQKQMLEEQVKKLSLEKNVKFVPWVSNPAEYIQNATALLLPSLTESYGAIAMEAHAAGTPVIMSDVGVANHELKPGPKVTILPINDKDKWVEAILKV